MNIILITPKKTQCGLTHWHNLTAMRRPSIPITPANSMAANCHRIKVVVVHLLDNRYSKRLWMFCDNSEAFYCAILEQHLCSCFGSSNSMPVG